MRTEAEIKSRVREIVSREFDRRIREASERLPHRCSHNYSHPLDTRRQLEGGPNKGYNRITLEDGSAVPQRIGLCILGSESPESWGGTICEEPIDAKKCPLFHPAKSPETVLFELEEDLRNPAWIEANLPEMHALVWVLVEMELRVPWWKRLLFRLRVIKLEPVIPPIDPTKLLSDRTLPP